MAPIIMVLASFHFSTLEEYYTGGLFLGLGNFITDGSVLIIGLFIAEGVIGNDFWLTMVFPDKNLRLNDCLNISICCIQVSTMYLW